MDTDYVIRQLAELLEKLWPYSNSNIYDIDETALSWKIILECTLGTVQIDKGNVAKAQIMTNFCCNTSRTNKPPIWFIGMSARPRYLITNGVTTDNLDMVWCSNKKSWINSEIFVEWLYWLDAHMTGRKIAL